MPLGRAKECAPVESGPGSDGDRGSVSCSLTEQPLPSMQTHGPVLVDSTTYSGRHEWVAGRHYHPSNHAGTVCSAGFCSIACTSRRLGIIDAKGVLDSFHLTESSVLISVRTLAPSRTRLTQSGGPPPKITLDCPFWVHTRNSAVSCC